MRLIRPLLAISLAAAAQPAADDGAMKNPFAGQPSAVESGRLLFRGSCAACHGSNGEGGRGPRLTDGRHLRGMNDARLYRAIRAGVPGTDMPASTLPEDKVWQIAAFVRSINAPAAESKPPGDVQAGQSLFFGKGGCINCHMIRGNGGALGPDLSNIGATQSATQIAESISKPSARIAEGFEGVTVATRDGRTIAGVAKNYSNYSIQILDATGSLHLLDRADLREVVFANKSLMPERDLDPADIRDLVAYLSRQVLRPGAPPAETTRRRRN